MTELDQNGDPQPKVEGDRDRPRGRNGAMRPSAVLTQAVSSDDQFERLQAEFRDNRRTPSHSPPARPGGRVGGRRRFGKGSEVKTSSRYGGRRRVDRARVAHGPPHLDPVLHSAPHILTDCPLVSVFRAHLLQDYSLRYLFWTVKGASALATFLLRSNSLLRPLPARPDPP